MLSKNRIKQLQSLQLKKNRDLEKLFIAEGKKTVLELLDHHAGLITEIFITPALLKTHADQISQKHISLTEVNEDEFARISLQASPAGIMAVCRYFDEVQPEFNFEKDFAFYLDEIRDPGNFGTIIRLADWFGSSTVFCSPNCCELYNPKVIQATMGAFLRVSVAYIELEELIEKQKIRTVYGALLEGRNLYREALKPGLIVIGNEANGISKHNLPRITHPVTIPASGSSGTESLNAAMASSIIASEFFRQLKL